MRLMIVLIAMVAVLALAACSRSDVDGPHRGQPAFYDWGGGGGGGGSM
jgi:hypothetical protein